MTAYRTLVQATGPAFLIVAFLARLPAAIGPLGVITLAATLTGGFAVAGAVAAAYGIGAAAGGPVIGALADRFGQRRVGVVAAIADAAAGLATAWIPARISPRTRYAASAVALALGALTLVLMASSRAGLLIAMALVGVTSAPYLISVGILTDAVSPARRAGVVMTLVGSGVVAGVALGAAVAGRLADGVGPLGAFAVPLGAGVFGLVIAAVSLRALRAAPTPASRVTVSAAA